MAENYEKDFVKEYGNLMLWFGRLRVGKDDLSRALYAEHLLESIKSIRLNNWGELYNSINDEKDLSLNELEETCNLSIQGWRAE